MTLILLSADLTVVSRVEGAAARAGMTVRVVSNRSAAVEVAAAETTDVLIIDLGSPVGDVKELVIDVKAQCPNARILAFGPHVHEQKLAAAREAGCDLVVSRGQFFAQVDALLQR
jgi:DNA-binding NarL/FixJ family response regulator